MPLDTQTTNILRSIFVVVCIDDYTTSQVQSLVEEVHPVKTKSMENAEQSPVHFSSDPVPVSGPDSSESEVAQPKKANSAMKVVDDTNSSDAEATEPEKTIKTSQEHSNQKHSHQVQDQILWYQQRIRTTAQGGSVTKRRVPATIFTTSKKIRKDCAMVSSDESVGKGSEYSLDSE
ncbi:hypothetical protein BDV97DRAFT_396172 [Delphinella strobiligena]|nr:hypothetical protein BDV97DRAFT_396172 [Delphinella strobiligena]